MHAANKLSTFQSNCKVDVAKMGIGEWGLGNGDWGMGIGEWGMGNGKSKHEKGAIKWEMRKHNSLIIKIPVYES